MGQLVCTYKLTALQVASPATGKPPELPFVTVLYGQSVSLEMSGRKTQAHKQRSVLPGTTKHRCELQSVEEIRNQTIK